ncbi:conserved hypothetical protein [Alteromonas sp. 38]|uniref:DUF349 domain-containing protein n=1 Tax=unclassified Alteromonas TaxID=2614992 RepID=UPI0012EEE7D0|nr:MULTISPECIES: DUF349 domain-containing protein [unclassified Alteromonas]CAD5270541.1 conserved hypothetical protein [Alteromonas sp. 154]VXB94369.1 conserved hypothetical protein [Alteromonas sp. 38]
MIFSRFFAPSHTSQNPEKRLEAIKSLSPEKPTDKTILHELAFNDANADVSLAALNKLNTFVLWLKMSQSAHHAKVKKVAERTVEAALMGQGDVTINANEKASFLRESANGELIQTVLVNDPSLLADNILVMTLLHKVDKPAFTQTIFLHHADNALQQAILGTIEDSSVLQKLEKKCRDSAIHAAIATKLQVLKAQAEKPIELMRRVTLCLSKYQVLVDKSDVEDIDKRQAELLSEYNDLMTDSSILSSDDKTAVDAKFARISEKVSRHLSRIRPEWEAQKAAKDKAEIEALCKQHLSHATTQVNWLYGERLCEATLADVAVVNESVRALEVSADHMASIGGSAKLLEEVRTGIASLNKSLEAFSMQQQYGQKLLICLSQVESLAEESRQQQTAGTPSESTKSAQDDKEKGLTEQTAELPEAASTDTTESVSIEGDAVQNGTHQNDEVSHKAPESIEAEFKALSEKYHDLRNELISVPSAINKRWHAASRVFSQKKQAKKAEVDHALRQCRKQISVVDNLIAQGKYRGAITKFEKLSATFESMPENVKKQLAKRFEKTAEDIAHLEGWQDYIAAPRKPALVEEAQTLASTPVEDIKQRGEAIRYLRQQWLSLGAGSDDNTLQSAFDAALELAFQPCREHYAALDAEREKALKARQSLIEQVAAIDLSQDEAVLAKLFDRTVKQWHECGQVEKREYESLKQRWNKTISPLQTKVNQWHAMNKKAKQQLVAQASALLAEEDIASATETAQQLQHSWKAIGHAGKRDESRLWREFRLANDALFGRLKEQRKAQSSAFDETFNTLFTQLNAIDSESDESTIATSIQDIESRAKDLPGAMRVKLDKKIAGIQKQQQTRAQQRHVRQVQQRAQSVISVLSESLRAGDITNISDDDADMLGKRWKSALSKPTPVQQSRHWLTVALEAATDIPSPKSDSSMRTNVQLTMMTAKLEKGESLSPAQLLEDWIAHGKVDDQETHLLERVVNVLDNNPEVVA